MLYDAHLHLQDPRLNAIRQQLPKLYASARVARVVVNGTAPDDWPAVLELARQHDWVIPSFGLHPWRIAAAPAGWPQQLVRHLDAAAELGRPYGLGECGLDKWMRGHDITRQKAVLHYQLELAQDRELPLSLHCLQAWGHLQEMLEHASLPECGFLLHSYGGPEELLGPFARLGAYFSLSGYFLRPEKAGKWATFKQIPLEQLLIETDAPDMLPPPSAIAHPLPEATNHPANLPAIYCLAAQSLGLSPTHLEQSVARNFHRLFERGFVTA